MAQRYRTFFRAGHPPIVAGRRGCCCVMQCTPPP
jgi:hypothetical protein